MPRPPCEDRKVPVFRSPAFVEPMTAVNVAVLPEGDQWLYEVKLDGYRALLLKHAGHVQIRSRKNNDLTATYPSIVAAALELNARSAVLDGEIVAFDEPGPSFVSGRSAPSHRRVRHRLLRVRPAASRRRRGICPIATV